MRLGCVAIALVLGRGQIHSAFAEQPDPTGDAPVDTAAPPDVDPSDPVIDDALAKATARKLLDGGDGFLKKGDQLAKRKKTAEAQGNYERALAAYQKAYELVPNPQILFPVAVAEEKLARWPDAARDYRRFLSQVVDPDPTLKADAEKRLDAAKINIGVLSLVVEPVGAHIAVDGVEVGVAPLTDPLYMAAGDYTIAITADGFQPFEQKLAVELGSESERNIDLVPIKVIVETPRKPPPPRPVIVVPPAPSRVPLYVGGVVTVGLIGGATFTGITAIGKHSDFTATGGTAQAREDARVSGKRMALLTDGLIAGSVVAVGVLTFYYLKVYRPKARLHGEQKRKAASAFDEFASASKILVTPWVQPNAGGFAISGSL
jgi:PEGA domain